MDEAVKNVKCADCGEALALDTTGPCPACGSEKRHFGIALGDTLAMHSSVSGVVKDPSQPRKKRDRVQFFSGDQLRGSKGDWVEKERVIDRNNDRYTEVVKDKATGEIIHKAEEPLSEHKGHGSDKLKGPKE